MAISKIKSSRYIKKRTLRTTLILIAFLIFLALMGIYISTNYSSIYNWYFSGSKTVELPTIDTRISSSSTGERYYLNADITLQFERPNPGRYNDIYQAVKDIVSGIDHDNITGENNLDYIKDTIKNGLADSIDVSEVDGIYISDFYTSQTPIIREDAESKKTLPPMNR